MESKSQTEIIQSEKVELKSIIDFLPISEKVKTEILQLDKSEPAQVLREYKSEYLLESEDHTDKTEESHSTDNFCSE